MKSEWKVKPISELVKFNPPYTLARGVTVSYVEMAALPVFNREISYFQEREFKGGGSRFKNGDVLFARITPCLQNGKTCRVSGLQDEQIANGSTEFIVLSAKDKKYDNGFVYYTSIDKVFREFAKGRMEGTTGRQRVSWQALSEYEMLIPPLIARRKIAHILSTLDDKIELNRKMNETLESMAQAIFKSWFVDFDPVHAKAGASSEDELDKAAKDLGISREVLDLFPSEFEESELGLIPRGWEVQPISALINLIGGGTPRRSESTYWNGALPWFSVKDMPPDSDVFVLDTEEKITKLGLTESSTKLLKKGTTIISARGTVGKLALLGTDMCMNQSCYGVRGKEVGPFFNYFNLREAVSTLQRNTHGAVFDTITTQTFNTYFSGFCGLVLSFEFENVIGPLMNRIELNVRENDSLRFARDTLLPKLLSGELDVSNLDLGLTDD